MIPLASLTWAIRPALYIAVPLALYGVGYWKGGNVAEQRCETESLKAQLVETERQRRASESALAEARRLHDEQQLEIARLNDEAEAYVALLDKLPPDQGSGCALSDDDVKRLRAIQ